MAFTATAMVRQTVSVRFWPQNLDLDPDQVSLCPRFTSGGGRRVSLSISGKLPAMEATKLRGLFVFSIAQRYPQVRPVSKYMKQWAVRLNFHNADCRHGHGDALSKSTNVNA